MPGTATCADVRSQTARCRGRRPEKCEESPREIRPAGHAVQTWGRCHGECRGAARQQ